MFNTRLVDPLDLLHVLLRREALQVGVYNGGTVVDGGAQGEQDVNLGRERCGG